MVKREKRLEKGIESLEEQKKIHQEKRKLAEELGEEELVGYYNKEIEKFKREMAKKKDKLDK
jgi:ubiquinone biosynthesis protein UbiJ